MGRKTKDSGIDGLLIVDKPTGWTSHDVVAKCRWAFGQRRAGHSGTLDPDATGVLLVGFGRVTKLLNYLTVLPKTYTGEVVLGSETSTLDASGDVTHTYDMSNVALTDVVAAAAKFVGEILQVPPMVSALSIDGVRLHTLARQGIEVERQARPVTIHGLSVDGEVEPGVFAITATVSSGTYIRTLAADIGTALGGGAHLRNLRRTQIGSFAAGDGALLDEAIGTQTLLSPAQAMRDYPSCVVDVPTEVFVRNGRVLPFAQVWTGPEEPPTGDWLVLAGDGEVLATYQRFGVEQAKPAVVVARVGVDF
jgi:tRNA pseudouridine55 synthase